MARNDWSAGDTLIRNRMNQPLWLVSGTIAGTGDAAGVARVFIGQGIVKWNNKSAPVVTTALRSVTFQAQANAEYEIFVRRDGSYVVSGTTTVGLGAFSANVTPPRWDAEPIGIVTTVALDTPGFSGPWNTATTSTATYEQRGQYNAIVSARPRTVYVNRDALSDSLAGIPQNGTLNAAVNFYNLASGIAFVSLDDSTNQMADATTVLQASVTWVPSGAIGYGGNQRVSLCPNFIVWRGEDYRTSQWCQAVQDQHVYEMSQDPDNQAGSTAPGVKQVHTTTFVSVNKVGATTAGYCLGMYHDPVVQRTTAVGIDSTQVAIRVTGLTFVALPGHKQTLPLATGGNAEPT